MTVEETVSEIREGRKNDGCLYVEAVEYVNNSKEDQ